MHPRKGAVLIVDDEGTIRNTLRRLMEQEGHEVITAASGEKALEEVSRREFDVVLLDVMMPGLSGIDVLHELHQKYPDTSIIMVTAVANVQTVIEAMKSGAYDYVIKPFDLDDVALKVEKARERRDLVLQNRKYQRNLEAMVEEQRERLRKQFVELIQSLAREHSALYALQTSGGRRGRGAESLEALPPEFRKPMGTVQEFAAALLRLIQERGAPPKEGEKRA